MAANVTLLVMDETICHKTDVFALVGLLVPIEQADPIRIALHSFMRELANQGDIVQPPPELHGSKMLKDVPWATDEHRLRCFEFVVRLLKEHELIVVRNAYFTTPLRRAFANFVLDDLRYGFCRQGLIDTIRPLLEDGFVLPIMDGINDKFARILGGYMPMLHALRSDPRPEVRQMTTPNLHHLMDPVFVDSRYFSIMQVADVKAYLLHIMDWVDLGVPLEGDFKPRLAEIAKTIDMTNIYSAPIIQMKVIPPVEVSA
jgi:hypothetical protein